MLKIFGLIITTNKEINKIKEVYFLRGRISIKAEQQIKQAVKYWTNALFGATATKKKPTRSKKK